MSGRISRLGGIPENYTYLIAGTQLAKTISIGDNITTMISFPTPKYYNTSTVYVNLTVAGFAELTDTGYSLLTNYRRHLLLRRCSAAKFRTQLTQVYGTPYSGYRGDMMIVSWENTLQKLWNTTLDSSTVDITFSVNVDRQKLDQPLEY